MDERLEGPELDALRRAIKRNYKREPANPNPMSNEELKEKPLRPAHNAEYVIDGILCRYVRNKFDRMADEWHRLEAWEITNRLVALKKQNAALKAEVETLNANRFADAVEHSILKKEIERLKREIEDLAGQISKNEEWATEVYQSGLRDGRKQNEPTDLTTPQ